MNLSRIALLTATLLAALIGVSSHASAQGSCPAPATGSPHWTFDGTPLGCYSESEDPGGCPPKTIPRWSQGQTGQNGIWLPPGTPIGCFVLGEVPGTTIPPGTKSPDGCPAPTFRHWAKDGTPIGCYSETSLRGGCPAGTTPRWSQGQTGQGGIWLPLGTPIGCLDLQEVASDTATSQPGQTTSKNSTPGSMGGSPTSTGGSPPPIVVLPPVNLPPPQRPGPTTATHPPPPVPCNPNPGTSGKVAALPPPTVPPPSVTKSGSGGSVYGASCKTVGGTTTCTGDDGKTCTTTTSDSCDPAKGSASAPPAPTKTASTTPVQACQSNPQMPSWGGTSSSTMTVGAGGSCGMGWVDSNGVTLDRLSATKPSHGTVHLTGKGNLIYTPDPGYSGPATDSFSVSIEEHYKDGRSATAKSNVTVTIK